MEEKILKIIKNMAVNNGCIKENEDIRDLIVEDLGLDSLDILDVSDKLDEHLGIKIPERELDGIFKPQRKIFEVVSILKERETK